MEIHRDMLRSTETCWDLQRHVEIHRDMLRSTETCWDPQRHVEIYRDMLRSTETCWDLQRHVEIHRDMLRSTETCWDPQRHVEIRWDPETCWDLQRHVARTCDWAEFCSEGCKHTDQVFLVSSRLLFLSVRWKRKEKKFRLHGSNQQLQHCVCTCVCVCVCVRAHCQTHLWFVIISEVLSASKGPVDTWASSWVGGGETVLLSLKSQIFMDQHIISRAESIAQ